MPRRFILPIATLFLFSGCTLSAQAQPATTIDAPADIQPVPSPTPVARPADAVTAMLKARLGDEGFRSVLSVGESAGIVTVTLASAPSTLGAAEFYWSLCRATVPLMAPGSAINSVTIAGPGGRAVVTATQTGCATP